MNYFADFLACVLPLIIFLASIMQIGMQLIEHKHPLVGGFEEVKGTRLHYEHVPAPLKPTGTGQARTSMTRSCRYGRCTKAGL
jgi:hypothetical protein